jgi:hypothetical protein
MPRDSGHRNKPAVPIVGRRVLKDVVPKRILVEETPLGPEPALKQDKDAEAVLARHLANEARDAAMTPEERAARIETDRVRAKDYNELDGLLDENNDLSVFDEIPKKNTKPKPQNTKMQKLRACLERI